MSRFDIKKADAVVNGSPALRKAICKEEPLYFAMYYFPEYFTYKIPDFHFDLYQDCRDLTTGAIVEAAWIIHRYGAKTALAKIALACWCICFKKKQYINWDAHDKANSEQALFDLTLALQTNRRIIQDFGHLYYQKKAKDAFSEAKMKRINSFITENQVKVEAFSTQQSTRGRLFGEIRPDLYILDDIETTRTKESRIVTQGIIDHYNEMKSGLTSGASILTLGNFIIDDGSIAHIMEQIKNSSRGRVRFIPVKNERGEISWPDRFVETKEEAAKLNTTIPDQKKWKQSLEEKRESLRTEVDGDSVYETEMMLNPAKSGTYFFDRDKVEAAIKLCKDPIETIAGLKIWAKYNPKHRYAGGADTSEGIGADANASAWIDHTQKPALVVATYQDNQIPPDTYGYELKRQGGFFSYPYLVPEINMTGYATVAALLNAEYPQAMIYRREVRNKTTQQIQKEYGWKATTGTKYEVLGEFKTSWEDGDIIVLDRSLLEEMKFFTKAAARLVNRENGATRHFDKLRAAALAWHGRKFAPLAQEDKKKLYTVPGQDKPYQM